LLNTGKVDLTSSIRKFYSQFNNIMSVQYKFTRDECCSYCLPTLTYGLENALLTENTLQKYNVVWNNCFRHIISPLLAWKCKASAVFL